MCAVLDVSTRNTTQEGTMGIRVFEVTTTLSKACQWRGGSYYLFCFLKLFALKEEIIVLDVSHYQDLGWRWTQGLKGGGHRFNCNYPLWL